LEYSHNETFFIGGWASLWSGQRLLQPCMHVIRFAITEADRVTGAFNRSQEIDQQHCMSCGVPKAAVVEHAETVCPHAVQEQYCTSTRFTCHEPAVDE